MGEYTAFEMMSRSIWDHMLWRQCNKSSLRHHFKRSVCSPPLIFKSFLMRLSDSYLTSSSDINSCWSNSHRKWRFLGHIFEYDFLSKLEKLMSILASNWIHMFQLNFASKYSLKHCTNILYWGCYTSNIVCFPHLSCINCDISMNSKSIFKILRPLNSSLTVLVWQRINMFFVKKSNYLIAGNGEGFWIHGIMVLSKHVGGICRSFHDNYVFIVLIILSLHDLCLSIVARCVPKLGNMTSGLCKLQALMWIFLNGIWSKLLALLMTKVYCINMWHRKALIITRAVKTSSWVKNNISWSRWHIFWRQNKYGCDVLIKDSSSIYQFDVIGDWNALSPLPLSCNQWVWTSYAELFQ